MKKEEKCDMDKNVKKLYRPSTQHWKFITIQKKKKKKKIEKYYVSSKCNNPVLKPCIISFDIIKHYENTGLNNRE